ncbi:unnamed protein product [Rhizophagus irregularis]|nr:unnamed protein product [Rhizophagus irregularis]
MPQNSNKRAQTVNLSETATFHECAEFFKKFGEVKNTKASTKNWVISLEKFCKEAGFIGKFDEIATEAELDQQLSEYIAAMRQQNGQEYSASSVRAAIAVIRRHLIDNSAIKGVDVQQESLFPNLWKVFNGKIKYLSDFGLNEPKGSDALTVDEIIQILNHQKMDSSTPRRLLYRIFFYNAILLGLRGGEHSSLMVDDFKKKPDGGFNVWIFRSKANQRVNTNHRGKGEKLILPNNPILINDYDRYIDLRPINAEPNFYLQEFEEETVRLKELMKEICIMTEINLDNRKITNHAGRKTMVQALQYLGQNTDCIRHQSRYKSDHTGLQPYILPHNQQQLDMMTSLVDEIHKKTSSDNISPINSMDINKEQVNGTFLTAKEVLKQSNRQNVMSTEANTSQIPLKSNNYVEIEMKPMQLQELLESGVLENTYLHIKLS